MSDINWSKAPEGYPIWIQDLTPNEDFDGSGWHRDDGDRYTDQDGAYWTKPEEGFYVVHMPPAPWTGTGLPPVGALVLAHEGSSEQYRVFAFDGEYVAIASEYTRVWRHASQVYPIRTPEQIAAEQIADVVRALDLRHMTDAHAKAIGEGLAAAGLRFKEAP